MARAAFDPDFGTATQALAALRRGAISSRELTAHALARIDKLNPALNCFVTVTPNEAPAAAKRADAQRGKRSGKSARLGPLHGLPIVVKGTYATKGVRTTNDVAGQSNNPWNLTRTPVGGFVLPPLASGARG